jgi:ferredoxin-type protein NapG
MSDDKSISRREMLGGRLLGRLTRHVASRIAETLETPDGATPTAVAPLPRPLHRPPHAINELAFVAQCTRCDACVDSCPPGAIAHAPESAGKAAQTPIIKPLEAPCVMCADTPCVTACQGDGSGVLTLQVSPRMGVARLLKPRCLAHNGHPCSDCVSACPVPGAIELRAGTPRVNTNICTGCGACAHACPVPATVIIIDVEEDRPFPPDQSSHP